MRGLDSSQIPQIIKESRYWLHLSAVDQAHRAWDGDCLTFSDSFVPLSSLVEKTTLKHKCWAFTSLAQKSTGCFCGPLIMGFFAPVYSGGLERRNSCFEQGALTSDLIVSWFCFLGPGDSWIRRMSSVTFSQMQCLLRSETGWPPPSHGRWGWCSEEARRSRGSRASSMQCRLGYLWRGKDICHSVTKAVKGTLVSNNSRLCFDVGLVFL